MRSSARRLFAAIVALLCLSGTGAAAEGETTVKVALLDMSSVMGGGMAGYGMMGPGMMGQGMMGPGQMGPGMMGGGMMGPGMMGMGMMSIRTDQPSVKAGMIHFNVTNWSRSFVHETLVVAVDNPNAAIPYNYAEARVAEDQVKVLGEVADLQPNASGTMDLSLTPGWYLLICNVAGHYAAGMVTQLHVSP
jgi:uncharacterized cupredoxin-like copper-binding protein